MDGSEGVRRDRRDEQLDVLVRAAQAIADKPARLAPLIYERLADDAVMGRVTHAMARLLADPRDASAVLSLRTTAARAAVAGETDGSQHYSLLTREDMLTATQAVMDAPTTQLLLRVKRALQAVEAAEKGARLLTSDETDQIAAVLVSGLAEMGL